VHAGPDPGNLVGDYDDVFCLSRWAADTFRKFYPGAGEEKIFLTRNGIDPSLFYGEEPVKEGYDGSQRVQVQGPLVVYSSSPDRGLDKLLDYWPEIRRMRPDARLRVFYGFGTWEKMAERRRDRVAQLQVSIMRSRLSAMVDQGVTFCGRHGQVVLADQYMRAAFWLYPTDFRETSCITAMEAQAAGCDVVATRLAALPETVFGETGHLVEPPNQLRRYREEFLGLVEEIFKKDRDASGMTECGRRVRELARERFPWSGVARQWSDHFAEVLG
jgi:glycosyltransferase involved in cell wall biosynthesis